MSNYSDNRITADSNHAWSKMLDFIPSDSYILDIGCSSGNLGEFLISQKKCVVDGVEPDENDAEIAAKKLHRVWNSDIETAINEIDQTYDVLIFADVLEHLLHPEQVLKLTKSLLKSGGRVVFSVPNMAHVSLRLALIEGNWQHTETGLLDKTHLHYWDIHSVKEIFWKASMNLVNLEAVVYKYPKKLIEKRLSDVGLSASRKAIDLLTGSEASTFQIVGVAEFSKTRNKTVELPDPMLQKDISYLAQNLSDQIKNQKLHIKDMENYILHLEEEIKKLEKEINNIESSSAYKTIKKLEHIKSKLYKH